MTKHRRICRVLVVVSVSTCLCCPATWAGISRNVAALSMVRHLRLYHQVSTTGYACALPVMANEHTWHVLDRARSIVAWALELAPKDARTWLYMGRLSCLLGDPESAVSALRRHTQLNSDSELGHAELGFAIDALCHGNIPSGTVDIALDGDHCPPAFAEERFASWERAGLDRRSFHLIAQQAIKHGHVEDALRWYRRSVLLCPSVVESCSSLFAFGVCALAQYGDLPSEVPSDLIPIMPLRSQLEIGPNELRWMREDQNYDLLYGEPLGKRTPNRSGCGVLWWDSSAVAVLDVGEGGEYAVTVVARHSNARTAALLLEHNFTPVATFILDDSKREYTATVHLPPGKQVLGVHYLADIGDAEVYTLRISRVSP